jgi:hypothetical protein
MSWWGRAVVAVAASEARGGVLTTIRPRGGGKEVCRPVDTGLCS